MKIGIDGSRAFLKNRTGIEEYSYQIIKHLRDKLDDHQVVLYIKENQKSKIKNQKDNSEDESVLNIPENWKIKVIKWPRFWTQIGLSLEMFFHPIDKLLIPAHTVPLIHPSDTTVVIHGLEYEFIKNGYSWWEKFYMKLSIKKSCKWANKIVCVSQNTKKDLVRLYGTSEGKIKVIYEGYEQQNFKFRNSNFESNSNDQILKIKNSKIHSKFKIQNSKFLLFIGRIEERKNIVNIIKAFEILKEKYKISHKLVLAGRPGFGYENAKLKMQNSKFRNDIIEMGFVSEEEKWELLKNAEVFVFPTQYEGFGIPILEAQSVGCPVVASDNSSIPEVAQSSALLADPSNCEAISENIYNLISDKELKNAIIQKGLENVKRFSWKKCASEIVEVILK